MLINENRQLVREILRPKERIQVNIFLNVEVNTDLLV